MLTDSNGNVVPATVSFDGSTDTATLTPSASLSYPATYTATISGATDLNGVAMTSTVSWSFTTSYQPGSTYTLWGNSVKPTIVVGQRLQPDRGRGPVRIERRRLDQPASASTTATPRAWIAMAIRVTPTSSTSGPSPAPSWPPPITP